MSEKSSTRLDTLETSGVSQPPSTYRKFCKTHCQTELSATRELYSHFESSTGVSRLENFDQCRTGAWFARNVHTGSVKVMSSSCKLRWCPMCSATRSWFLTQQVSKWLKIVVKPKFLTLTLAHTSAPLPDQVEHLYTCFRKFRKLNIMKRNVLGGVWFFQIKKSDKDGLWHPHLHCVIDSEYMDKFALSTAWATVTVTSKIIDIKKVDDKDKMAEYVARYAARPSLLSTLSLSDRNVLFESLHGRRLVGTWGSARSISLRPAKPPDAKDWKKVGEWWTVVNLIHDDWRAEAIWRSFRTDTPIPEDCNILDLEDEINNVQRYTPNTVEENYQLLLDFY